MANGTLTSVTYLDPWGITPPGTSQTGVIVITSSNPPSTVLCGCLVQGTTQLAVGISATNSMVRILPDAPLSSLLPYQVWLQWLPAGQTPTWPAPGMLTAALVLSVPTLTSVSVSSPNVTATWALAPGAGGNAGAHVVFFDNQLGRSAGYIQSGGNSGSSSSVVLSGSESYVAYIQAVQPASAQPVGGFNPPFSYGPWAAPVPVASAAPTVKAVTCDGSALAVSWSPVTAPTDPAASAVTYSLNLVDAANNVLASFPASANGGIAPTNLPLQSAAINVAGQVQFGAALGPMGASVPVIALAPTLEQIALSASGGTVTAAVTLGAPAAGLPTGTVITVELLQDGVVVASAQATGTPPGASVSITPRASSSYDVRAAFTAGSTSSPPAISGPFSPPAGIVMTPAQNVAASYDGHAISIVWSPIEDDALTGYEVTLTPATGAVVATTTATSIALPLALAPGDTCSISVRPLSGLARGLPGTAVTFTAPTPSTPSISGCWFDGEDVTLAWNPSSGVGVDGYVVALDGKADDHSVSDITSSLRTGVEPVVRFPLPLDDTPRTWTVTVAPTVRSYTGTPSAAFTVFTAVPVLSTVALSGTAPNLVATGSWSLADTTQALLTVLKSAKLQIQILDGADVILRQAIAIEAASGTLSIPLPASASSRLALAAQTVASNETGPRSSAVALLTVQPSTPIGSYDGNWLALDWGSPGAGVTGHTITLTPSSGSPVTLSGGAAPGVLVPMTLALGETWSATVQPNGVNTTGLKSAAGTIALPAVVAPAISSVRYQDGTVTAAWSTAGTGDITYVLVLLANGTATVTQHVGAALSGSVAKNLVSGTQYTVTVQAIVGRVAGPTSTPAPVALTSLQVNSATTDPVSGQMTLAWSDPSPNPQCEVRLVAGGIVSERIVSGASLVLAPPPAPGTVAAASLAAITTAAGVTQIAPYGAVFAIPTGQPELLSASYDGTTLTASWTPLPGASGYTVSVLESGSAAPFTQTHTTGPATQTTFDLSITKTDTAYSVVVQGNFAASSGPASGPVPMMLGVPTVASPTFDGCTLSIPVTAPAGATGLTGFDVVLLRDGAPVQNASVPAPATGQPILLPITSAINAAGSYSLQVRARAGCFAGAAASAPLVLAAPVVTLYSFDPVTGDCSVKWNPITSGTSTIEYSIVVTNGSTVVVTETVAAPAASYTIPAAKIPSGGDYALTVAASAKAGTYTSTGPACAPVPLMTTAPSRVAVIYNGATLQVSWNTVSSALVTGYRVSAIVSGTPTTLGDTAAASARFQLAADSSKTYGILVQAMIGPNVGAPSTSMPLLPQALFLSLTSQSTPYVAPATSFVTSNGIEQIPATDIDIYLPNIFTTAPTPTQLPNTPPFVVTPVTGQPPFAYKLTLAASSPAWTFTAEPVRSALQAAYTTFLSALQTLTATPAGIHVVREALSRTMPQSFAELPYYAYGASFTGGYVDLRPGMVLHVEFESYQSYPPQTADAKYLSGFVTTGVSDYEIGSYVANGAWLTGLDAFLANLTSAGGVVVQPGIPNPPDPTGRTYGGGGIVDTFFTQFRQPFCRLVYPADLLQDNSSGSAYPYSNPVLIAGPVLADIEAATTRLRNKQLPDGNSVAWLYLRGRATYTALVRIVVNGVPRLVPVGTTVGNILAAHGVEPPVAGLVLNNLSMTRARGAAVSDPSIGQAGYTVGNAWIVRLNWAPSLASDSSANWLALPVLHGDEITWSAVPS